MTAEERLKKWYDDIDAYENVEYFGKPVEISPEHIDLIADLVVERLNRCLD